MAYGLKSSSCDPLIYLLKITECEMKSKKGKCKVEKYDGLLHVQLLQMELFSST